MKKKTIKVKGEFSQQEITLTVDARLDKLDLKMMNPRALAEANKAIPKMGNIFRNN
ncbi:hypothetical protein [Chitinophaga sp. Cy-1792]|uniref:hypothetical protein n=1 Tax=Chitinophaga sp. Cy-1792 TaxID=2608339 RepID=UPI001421E7CB|nr:hypothetical protein [Chitinophaga sp. Cy-1792]